MSINQSHSVPRLPRGVLRFLAISALSLSISALIPAALAAQTVNFEPVRPDIVSARMSGFGGSFCALEAGFDTLTTNPAALAWVSKEWSVARLAAHVSGPLFDLPSVLQSDDIATGILDLVGDNNGVYIGTDITGPLAFGKVDRNFGFGVFNRSILSADVPTISKATVLAGEEILLVGGYGLTVFEKDAHSIALGLQMKGFFQTFLYDSGTSVTILTTFTSLDVDAVPAVLSTGFGIDAGVMYRFGKDFSAAITCKDAFTPVFSTVYPNFSGYLDGTPDGDTDYALLDPVLSAGVAYSIPVPESWSTISRWDIMLDYRDFLSLADEFFPKNPVLNIAAGTEITLLDVVSLRAGISETYLSTGLGLDLTVCQIDFAMYGSELGLQPGKRPLLNMALSVSFEY